MNESATEAFRKSPNSMRNLILTGCIYWPGMPTAFTRPGATAAALAAAPAPDDVRRFDRCLCLLRLALPVGRNSGCCSCSFGSIIGGGCSNVLLSYNQQKVAEKLFNAVYYLQMFLRTKSQQKLPNLK